MTHTATPAAPPQRLPQIVDETGAQASEEFS